MGLLSSQTASELLLAARSERFPAKVQLGNRGYLAGKAPLTPRISQMGPEPGQVQGDVGETGVRAGLSQAASDSRTKVAEERARALPAPRPWPYPRVPKAAAHPQHPSLWLFISPIRAFTPEPLPHQASPPGLRASHTPSPGPQSHRHPTLACYEGWKEEAGPGLSRGQGRRGGPGPGDPPASSLLLPDPAPGSQAPAALAARPLGHSLGPGLAGLVVAWGKVSWWARGTVCSETAGQAQPVCHRRRRAGGLGAGSHPHGLQKSLPAHGSPRPQPRAPCPQLRMAC